MDIASELQQVAVCIDQQGFVSSLKKVPCLFPDAVYVSGIAKGEVLNNTRKRNFIHLNNEVNVIGH
jgi:hypothetical protein